MAETGMANKFYSYKASYKKGKAFSGIPTGNGANDDSGVFVVPNSDTNTIDDFGPSMDRKNASNSYVCGTYCSYGGINMCTINNSIKNWSVGLVLYNGRIRLGLSQNASFNTLGVGAGADIYSDLRYSPGDEHSMSVYKTEVAYQKSDAEYVYTTGLSSIAFAEDGSIYSYATMILARAAPTDGTGYPTLGAISGLEGTYCTDASVVFSDIGKVLGILESNDTAAVTSTSISTSFPEEALSANDGIIAVSCMAGVDGKARWMGYKNGIYKLYHGTKPLYGMPGESVTIKGHKFRCLAYSPFYARMS